MMIVSPPVCISVYRVGSLPEFNNHQRGKIELGLFEQ